MNHPGDFNIEMWYGQSQSGRHHQKSVETFKRLIISRKTRSILIYMEYSKVLYFDYQATTPVADEVLHKMQPYFTESFANPHASDHALGWKSAASV
ncbi:aminotransferase class V-fold PLP-dependent enzyme, partial [Thiolapillus sp.]